MRSGMLPDGYTSQLERAFSMVNAMDSQKNGNPCSILQTIEFVPNTHYRGKIILKSTRRAWIMCPESTESSIRDHAEQQLYTILPGIMCLAIKRTVAMALPHILAQQKWYANLFWVLESRINFDNILHRSHAF